MRPYFYSLALATLLLTASAHAASECAEEQLRHCGHLVNKDKHLIAACFVENMKRFTPSCQDVARTIIRNVNESEYCRDDFQRFCNYAGPIPPSVEDMEILFPCMIKYHDEFSEKCQGYIAKNLKEMEE